MVNKSKSLALRGLLFNRLNLDSRKKTEENAAPLTCIGWTGPLDLRTERKDSDELGVALN